MITYYLHAVGRGALDERDGFVDAPVEVEPHGLSLDGADADVDVTGRHVYYDYYSGFLLGHLVLPYFEKNTVLLKMHVEK